MDEELNTINDKDQKLALFQEITHSDDFEQSQAILESTNWDLDQAIQSFYSGAFNTNSLNEIETQTHIQEVSDLNHHQFEPPVDLIQQTSLDSNHTSKRLLNFNIEYLNIKFTLHVPDNETVLKLKELIKEKLNIPTEYIKLSGWLNKNIFVTDKMKLSELNLPLDTNLYVKNTSDQNADVSNLGPQTSSSTSANGTQTEDSDKNFELHIKIINPRGQITIINQSSTFSFEKSTEQDASTSSNDKFYRLNFDSSTKFIEIRRTISKLTQIIANNQEWWFYKGDDLDEIKNANNLASFHRLIENDKLFSLPLNSLVEDMASLLSIKQVLDDLNESSSKNSKLTPSALSTSSTNVKIGFIVTVKSSDDFSANPFERLLNEKSSSKQDLMESQEIEEYDDDNHIGNDEDIEDNFLSEENTNYKQKTLIPADCPVGDELKCTNAFNEEFSNRYGHLTPLFYIGSLEDAIREALLCPAKERKLLGLYLHSDHTVFHNIFCSKTLCDENVVNFLSSNFVVWPWDLSLKQNENYFYDKCSKYLGSVFTSSLRSMKDKLPVFLIVTRVRGSNEVAAIIEGDSTNEIMLHRLMQTYEMFEMQRIKDESDEKTRDERERIKREQDAAYQASLEFDKAKRQKQVEENERMKIEAELEAEKERKRLEEIDNRKLEAFNNLPTEPTDDVPTNKTSRIRFRLPDGENVQRKFFIDNKLKTLVDFMTSRGYFVEEYKLLSSWPRKDLTSENLEKTLEEMKLFPQETLTLEQR